LARSRASRRVSGGTAIEQAREEGNPEHGPAAVDEQAAEAELGLGSTVAVILLVVVCALLVVLPAAIALQAPSVPVGWLAAGGGGFIGVILSLKLAAGAWGVAAHLWSVYPGRVVTVNAN
jgi:hypothetical protein